MTKVIELSIVIPVYRSTSTLIELHRRLENIIHSLNINGEIIYVDDASPDHSASVLESLTSSIPCQIINLNQNIGQSGALLVGMYFSDGNLIATMDADLQDEPEKLPLLIENIDHFDVIFAGRKGDYESKSKLFTSLLFKSLVHFVSGRRIPKQAGLFLLIKRPAAHRLIPYLPLSPYLLGLIAKEKLECTSIIIDRSKNSLGETSYTFRKRLKVARQFFKTLWMQPLSKNVDVWLKSKLSQ